MCAQATTTAAADDDNDDGCCRVPSIPLCGIGGDTAATTILYSQCLHSVSFSCKTRNSTHSAALEPVRTTTTTGCSRRLFIRCRFCIIDGRARSCSVVSIKDKASSTTMAGEGFVTETSTKGATECESAPDKAVAANKV